MRNFTFKSFFIFGFLVGFFLIINWKCKNHEHKSELEECRRINDSLRNTIDTIGLKKKLLSNSKVLEYINKNNLNVTTESSINKIIRATVTVSSKPLYEWEVHNCAHLFNTVYKAGVNFTINNTELRIKWNVLDEFLNLKSIRNREDTVVAIYYVINDTTDYNNYFSYIITKAVRTKTAEGADTITPVSPNAQGTFLMLNNQPGLNYFQPVTPSRFKYYHELYKDKDLQYNNLELLGTPLGYTQYARNLVAIHPRISFHTGKKFFEFFDGNDSDFKNLSDVYLVFTNGAFHKKGISINVCSPIMFFEEGPKRFYDDNDHPGKSTFYMRALDVGSLCPPECN